MPPRPPDHVTGTDPGSHRDRLRPAPHRVARAGRELAAFAGSLLVIGGAFKIFDALWAFKYDDEISTEVQTILFENDLES